MKLSILAAATAALMLTGTARAALYTAQDDGSAIGGPNVNSDAANAAFLADATSYGQVNTLTFDTDATSDLATYSYSGLTITSSASGFGDGFSGVSDTTLGSLYGYDVTGGGSGKWIGFPTGSATFALTAPTHAFGFYLTGVQTAFTSALTVTIDGVDYDAPINVNGGAAYFGFTSATGFSNVTVTNTSGDAWGIDGVSYNLATAAVPETATWAMMIGGIGVAGASLRRRNRRGDRTVALA